MLLCLALKTSTRREHSPDMTDMNAIELACTAVGLTLWYAQKVIKLTEPTRKAAEERGPEGARKERQKISEAECH